MLSFWPIRATLQMCRERHVTGPTGTSGRESAPPIVRLAHLMAFTSFLHEVGVPAERRLRRRGLPAYCQDPAAFVPLSRVWSFFDDADRNDVPMIGLLATTPVAITVSAQRPCADPVRSSAMWAIVLRRAM